MPDDPRDRRGGHRFAARIKVGFRSIDELITAYTEDVSRGGLYVTATSLLPPGTRVQLSLQLPDGAAPALVPAIVTYALDAEAARAQGRNPGMGMRFLEEDLEPIAERIANVLTENVTSGAHERPKPIHALVVEDSALVRKQIASALETYGHRVTLASHGLEALGKAMRDPPDVVLSDVNMPVMDGWQLLRLLRARDATRDVPVVFLTALDSEHDRIRGYELGVDDYVPKPFASDELVARVMRIVTRTRWEGRVAESGMSGDLRQVTLTSLLAFLDAERRSGLLSVNTPAGEVRIGVREGAVTSVDLPDPDAPTALLERLLLALAVEEGRFNLDEVELVESKESVGVQMALMEHARRQDEAAR